MVMPMLDILHGRVLLSPEKILHARLIRGVWELLVKWTGHSEAKPTWEQLKDFKQKYPRVELTDELFVGEGANVIDAFVGRQYQHHQH
jgi:hypothetical protein